MSRFLVTCWPFTGHVHNQLAIAETLRERGHDVRFYTGPSARRLLEAEGFSVFEFEHLDERRGYDGLRALEPGDARARASPGTVRRALRDWLVETIPDQLADLEPLLARWRPDVLVCDLSLWGPIMVLWEKTGLPVALSSTFMGPLIPGPDAPPWGLGMAPPRTRRQRAVAAAITWATERAGAPMRARLDELRAEHGLAPAGATPNAFTARLPLYLVGNVPELDYARRDLPDSVHYLGSCVWHPPVSIEDATWLESLPADRPWVHVSESTVRTGDPYLLRAAAEGLGDTPVQVVMSAGGHRDPQTLPLGPLPANVHLTRWISHAALLPRCAAVVTGGGAATVIAALRCGVPLVVVPTAHDKPDNARRVVQAGAGVRLAARDCTPERLRDAVLEVLDDARYRQRAQELSERLEQAPGPAGAAELLEHLVPPVGAMAPATTLRAP
jgi:MGT family glycosyltransferase